MCVFMWVFDEFLMTFKHCNYFVWLPKEICSETWDHYFLFVHHINLNITMYHYVCALMVPNVHVLLITPEGPIDRFEDAQPNANNGEASRANVVE